MGRMLDPILQSNILYLSCTFSFRILVHGVLGMIVKEGRLFLKADWTENLPFGSRIQTSLSKIGIKGIGILLIASTESIHKISFNFGKSQDLVARWIRQDTTKFLLLSFSLGKKFVSHGTHGSFQISMIVPFPSRKHALLTISFFYFSIAFHVGEAFWIRWAISQSSWTLYLLLKAWIQILPRLEITFQASFSKKASLNFLDFLNPSPPWYIFWETQ